MKLFEDKVSSAVSRVRITLALKGVEVEAVPVTILGPDASSRTEAYRQVNPQGLVPALLTDDGALLTQSLAIVEYLEERFPEPALLPRDPVARALARSVAMAVASEIHALLPPRVARWLDANLAAGPDVLAAWKRHWMEEGLAAIEALLARQPAGTYAVGDAPSVADVFLYPQAVNAERAGIELSQWPRIRSVVTALNAIPAFAENLPERPK